MKKIVLVILVCSSVLFGGFLDTELKWMYNVKSNVCVETPVENLEIVHDMILSRTWTINTMSRSTSDVDVLTIININNDSSLTFTSTKAMCHAYAKAYTDNIED